MFVAVRAMAPVAGRPPNNGETKLATPWAISSTFGLWRSPLIRSATTADINDSIAPSIVIVSTDESRPGTRSRRSTGTSKCGRPDGIPPKRVPTVSTGRCSA
jgi:hypothetical protein